jgi:imidazolonepropionase-like amidohydrolase
VSERLNLAVGADAPSPESSRGRWHGLDDARHGGDALVGATLIDGTGAAPLRDSAVVIRDGRIESVGVASSFDGMHDLRVIDVHGKHVIPGLLDANVHLLLHCDPDVLLRYEPGVYDALVLEAAQVALRAGITTVFDTWGPLESLRRVRDRVNAGEATGSRIFFAGNIIGNDGPWSPDFYPYGDRINQEVARSVNEPWEQGVGASLTWMSAEDVRKTVREYIATSRIDFVKYASSSHALFRFIALSPDAQRAIVDEAHSAGLIAQACTLTPEALKLAIQAGVDLLQHANSTGRQPIPPETLDLITERQIPAVVLLPTERFLAAVRAANELPGHWRESFDVKESNARSLISAGARLLHATDGGVFGRTAKTSPWFGPILRLPDTPLLLGSSHILWHQAMIERGMKPLDGLLAATRNIADAYDQNDIGTIEPGKRADLLVLDANPLDSPANYGRISQVMKDGEFVDRQRLPERPVLTLDASRRPELST